MLEGGLANLGFLGGSFQWWIGQICDDSTWRDNILPYKFEEAGQINGWGYRYKVRILGINTMSTSKSFQDKSFSYSIGVPNSFFINLNIFCIFL